MLMLYRVWVPGRDSRPLLTSRVSNCTGNQKCMALPAAFLICAVAMQGAGAREEQVHQALPRHALFMQGGGARVQEKCHQPMLNNAVLPCWPVQDAGAWPQEQASRVALKASHIFTYTGQSALSGAVGCVPDLRCCHAGCGCQGAGEDVRGRPLSPVSEQSLYAPVLIDIRLHR